MSGQTREGLPATAQQPPEVLTSGTGVGCTGAGVVDRALEEAVFFL